MISYAKRPRLPAITCPHCQAKSIVRDSVQVTPTVRELRLTCDNDECGHTFVCQLSVIRTIRPSAKPNPAIRLPFGNQNLGPKARSANDDSPVPANDDHGVVAAIAAIMKT